MYIKAYNKFQQFKNRKTLYGKLTPKIAPALKLWNLVYIDLMSLYAKSIRQQHPGRAIIKKGVSLTCMKIIDPVTGWLKQFEVRCFEIDKLERVNIEYIEKYYARESQLFNQTWLCRYPRPCKVDFDNGSEFK